ncbi:hypothetical protein BDR07DRAFT_560306 [Suillus spraguei]|nr:hypothetical protein BDR07DRAFT_560306 [Suillus spraguei]
MFSLVLHPMALLTKISSNVSLMMSRAAEAWCFYGFQISMVTPRLTHFLLTPISGILLSATSSLTPWILSKAREHTLRLTHFSSAPISRILPSMDTSLTPWILPRCDCCLEGEMENIHSETHSLLIDTYIKDSAQRKYLFGTTDTTSRKAPLSERAGSRVSNKATCRH